MKQILSNINIAVNEKIYLKNPESSELGKKIIRGSIELINDVGFEAFTFKKLGNQIKSTEASTSWVILVIFVILGGSIFRYYANYATYYNRKLTAENIYTFSF